MQKRVLHMCMYVVSRKANKINVETQSLNANAIIRFVCPKINRLICWDFFLFHFETWLRPMRLMKSQMKSKNMCLLFLFGDDYDVDNESNNNDDDYADVERKRIHLLHYFVHERFSPTIRRMIYLVFTTFHGIVVVRLWKWFFFFFVFLSVFVKNEHLDI